MRSYEVVDVFADVPLQGNPVAVFTDGEGLSTELMQRTARELNLSETVFVTAGRDGGRRVRADLHPGHRDALRRASDPRHRLRARASATAPSAWPC